MTMAAKRQILSRDTFGTLGHHISTARTYAEDVQQGVLGMRDTTLCQCLYLCNCDFAQKLGGLQAEDTLAKVVVTHSQATPHKAVQGVCTFVLRF